MSTKQQGDVDGLGQAFRRAIESTSTARASATDPAEAVGRVTAHSPRHASDRPADVADTPVARVDLAFSQFEGWHLGIAAQCLKIDHGAFAALCIAFSYFETIWQLDRGRSSRGRGVSRLAFREGLVMVFPSLGNCTDTLIRDLAEALYSGFRNSFFHNMIAGHNVSISSEYPWLLLFLDNGVPALALSRDGALHTAEGLPGEYAARAHAYAGTKGKFVCLDPHQFIPALIAHLHAFREELESSGGDRMERFLRGYEGLLAARPTQPST